MLRLLMPTDNHVVLNPSIRLDDGRCWEVVNADSFPSTPAYTCISYEWGVDPIPNSMYGDPNPMSARTMIVLQTGIDAVLDDEQPAIWIDAFCLPPRGDPSRSDALDKMGDIYLGASRVVVVLSEMSYSFLKLAKDGIQSQANMSHTPALEALEKDTWITRVWTYQEIANSDGWLFVTEGHPEDTSVDGTSLLNALGNTKMAYQRPYEYDDGTIRTPDSETVVRLRLPNIDLFEDVLEDCMAGLPRQRSALQTMSNTTRRIRERGEDYFNAMIGAVAGSAESHSIRMNWKNMTESPLVKELGNQVVYRGAEAEREEGIVDFIMKPIKIAFAANRFMQTCERNGDYSFIYTTSDRSKLKGQTWRPVADVLKPICPSHCWGVSQPGGIVAGRLALHQMLPMRQRALSDAAQNFIAAWVRLFHPDESLPASIHKVKDCLRKVGFSAAEETLALKDGYFFPQRGMNEQNFSQVFVSSAIRWVFGAPAITINQGKGGRYTGTFVCVGVFVGDVYAIAKASEATTVVLE